MALVNDLSDLFVPGAIPASPEFSVKASRLVQDRLTHRFIQLVDIRNTGTSPAWAPLFLVLDNLSANATLLNSNGTSAILGPVGSPYVRIDAGDGDHDRDDFLRPQESRTVALEFLDPSRQDIGYDARVLSVTPAP